MQIRHSTKQTQESPYHFTKQSFTSEDSKERNFLPPTKVNANFSPSSAIFEKNFREEPGKEAPNANAVHAGKALGNLVPRAFSRLEARMPNAMLQPFWEGNEARSNSLLYKQKILPKRNILLRLR